MREPNYELSRVRVEQARQRLAKTQLIAPFDALVSNRYVDNRTRISIGDPIVRLTDVNSLKVVVAFPEHLMATLPSLASAVPSSQATAEFTVLAGTEFPLTFSENTGEANAVAQTYSVSFSMRSPADLNLLPGMTARVKIQSLSPATDRDFTIPTSALQSAADGDFFVWRYDENTHEVHKQSVEVSELSSGGIKITSGLAAGELLVAAGASQLQEGMRVRPLGQPQTHL